MSELFDIPYMIDQLFHNCPHMDLSTVERLEQRMINLPSSAKLGATHGE